MEPRFFDSVEPLDAQPTIRDYNSLSWVQCSFSWYLCAQKSPYALEIDTIRTGKFDGCCPSKDSCPQLLDSMPSFSSTLCRAVSTCRLIIIIKLVVQRCKELMTLRANTVIIKRFTLHPSLPPLNEFFDSKRVKIPKVT